MSLETHTLDMPGFAFDEDGPSQLSRITSRFKALSDIDVDYQEDVSGNFDVFDISLPLTYDSEYYGGNIVERLEAPNNESHELVVFI